MAQAAPRTVRLVYSLLEAGAYNTNHFFRVDRGFVAQVADVPGGRLARMDAFQQVRSSHLFGRWRFM